MRFNQLSFIAGPPHFRYYAGVPLRTNRGINIGSIYILDSKVRPALTPSEKAFLGTMADNVIQHLEMTRDKKDRQRTFKMNECLQAYVDPMSEYAKHRRRYSNRSESTGSDTDADSKRTADGSERLEVITRAAELLREAMDIEDGGGGVLFLDTSLAAVPVQQATIGGDRANETTAVDGLEEQELRRSSQQMTGPDLTPTSRPSTRSSSPEIRRKRNGSTEVLAHTYRSVSTSPEQPEFTSFTPEEITRLIKRYPRGKMFVFDQQGEELSDSSENGSLSSGRPRSLRRRQRSTADSTNIHGHFPKARQIIFIPLWDATTSRSSVCFVYNCSEYRNFSHQLEFLYCITFANCVDTELTRLANLKANEQKSDFIGSISHELRSPLHGILASCEFLQDTPCTSFQQSLVNTAESCARTLLDTVNMVLDYSKINAFEKNKRNNTLPALADHPDALQTSLSTYRNVDLAVLTEEVVEGVATGHAYHDPQNRALRPRSREGGSDGQAALAPCKPDVNLIVEIKEHNWMYWCEPGSFRRIVMNLVGNSLKYTKVGFVHVQLAPQIMEQSPIEEMVLTITDSGQGISPEYLKNKLFTPFAQESNQTPGIGLGLSLVKSIVSTMGGHIDVTSTVGVGTKVTVRIPLTRQSARANKAGTDADANAPKDRVSSTADDSNLRQIKAQSKGKSAALFWHERKGASMQASQLMRKSLTAYLETWYGFSVSQWRKEVAADIVIVEEASLDALLCDAPQLSACDSRTMVLVLRRTGSAQASGGGLPCNNMEDVRHPFGPQKLAKALQACLDRSQPKSGDSADNGKTNSLGELLHSVTAAAGALNISDVEAAPMDQTLKDNNESLQSTADGAKANVQVDVEVDVKFGAPDPPAVLISKLTTPFVAAAAPFSTPAADMARRVLLVDDNAINLRLLQVGMKKSGYTSISSASDGLQAVNTYRALLASSTPPDIILMDLSMPIMTGFEATRQIREIEAEYNGSLGPVQAPHHSLIIALTGLASVRDQKEAYMAGVDSYIMKPVSFAKLTKLLEDWTADGKVVATRVESVPGIAVAAF